MAENKPNIILWQRCPAKLDRRIKLASGQTDRWIDVGWRDGWIDRQMVRGMTKTEK